MISRQLRKYFAHSEELDLAKLTTLSYKIATDAPANAEDIAIELARVVTERLPSRIEYMPISDGGISVLDISRNAQWTQFTMAISDLYWRPEDGLPSLLELAISMAEYDYASGIWLSNIDIPKHHMSQLGGPRYGISALREKLEEPIAPILAMAFGALRPNFFEQNEESIVRSLVGGVDILLQDMRMPLGQWESKESQFRSVINIRDKASEKSKNDKMILCTLS